MKRKKKHFKRLIRVYRLQKKFRTKKKQIINRQPYSKKQAVGEDKVVALTQGAPKKSGLFSVVGVVLVVVGLFSVKHIQKRYDEKCSKLLKDSNEDTILFDDMGDFGQKDYDEASLEELEEALYRVENEIDDVSAAIESKIK